MIEMRKRISFWLPSTAVVMGTVTGSGAKVILNFGVLFCFENIFCRSLLSHLASLLSSLSASVSLFKVH